MCKKLWYISSLVIISSLLFIVEIHAQQGNIICNLDGVVDDGEACDDGNNFNCDYCTNQCQPGPKLDFVLMAEGTFNMGHTRIRSARPVHRVELASFWISRREITNQDYSFCVDAGECSLPKNRTGCTYRQDDSENLPVNCVSWTQAKEFAEWCGTALNLPTEAQWEYAAKDQGSDIEYPMSEDPSCDTANFRGCGNQTNAVCSTGNRNIHRGMIAQNASGLCDMGGNVKEWVYDTYTSYRNFTHEQGAAYHVEGRRGRNKVIRGGSYLDRSNKLQTGYRNRFKSNRFSKDLGFRVACVEGECPIAELSVCGNGDQEQGEECDDGNLETESCDYGLESCVVCAADCTEQDGAVAFCGDDIIQGDQEECDDARETERCNSNCTTARCGDGIFNETAGEECDDGDRDDLNECKNDCTLPFCGNGEVEVGEECDDGDRDDLNECKNDCTEPFCGNGVVEVGEDCDDGDVDDANECPNNCTLASISFSQNFTEGEIHTPSRQCEAWKDFQNSINADQIYNRIRIYGSQDEIGRSCEGAGANTLCQALRQNIRVSVPCDGRIWSTGRCFNRDHGEDRVQITTNGNNCSCSDDAYTVRPCIGNQNWGGLGETCDASTQTLSVECE